MGITYKCVVHVFAHYPTVGEIMCRHTVVIIIWFFGLVFIVFVTSHSGNVMHKTFGGYVLHGEPLHHVKHLILFYRITFEIS